MHHLGQGKSAAALQAGGGMPPSPRLQRTCGLRSHQQAAHHHSCLTITVMEIIRHAMDWKRQLTVPQDTGERARAWRCSGGARLRAGRGGKQDCPAGACNSVMGLSSLWLQVRVDTGQGLSLFA